MIYMSREQTPSKGGDKQTWPRKAPCSPSALAFFAPSLQIKSGIPRLGSCHIRGRITVSTSPQIILSGSAKTAPQTQHRQWFTNNRPQHLDSMWFSHQLWHNLCCHMIQGAYCNCTNMWSKVHICYFVVLVYAYSIINHIISVSLCHPEHSLAHHKTTTARRARKKHKPKTYLSRLKLCILVPIMCWQRKANLLTIYLIKCIIASIKRRCPVFWDIFLELWQCFKLAEMCCQRNSIVIIYIVYQHLS